MIGVIGIVCMFMYVGVKGMVLYDENIVVWSEMMEEEYRYGKLMVIVYFYEKLLKFIVLMNI